MPKAYVICYVDITDTTKYSEYRTLAGPAVPLYNGKYLARGGYKEVLEGDLDPERAVVIEFPDADSARQWYTSPEYTRAKAARAGASRGSFILVEGIEDENGSGR